MARGRLKGCIPWNKGKTGVYTTEQLERIRIGTINAMKNPEVRSKISNKLKGKYIGKNNFNWKGDNITKGPVHKWVEKELGKPNICENCEFEYMNSRRLNWANISGEYKRDISDWARLCISCHNRFDNSTVRGWVTRRNNQLRKAI